MTELITICFVTQGLLIALLLTFRLGRVVEVLQTIAMEMSQLRTAIERYPPRPRSE